MEVPMLCCCSSTIGQAITKAQTLPSSSFPPGIVCHSKCSITFNIRSLCTSRGLWEVGMALFRRWCENFLGEPQFAPTFVSNNNQSGYLNFGKLSSRLHLVVGGNNQAKLLSRNLKVANLLHQGMFKPPRQCSPNTCLQTMPTEG